MEQLDKEVLLAKAKRNYPIGTKFISPIGKHECEIINDSVEFLYNETKDFIWLLMGHIGKGNRVYEKGIWAEIIYTQKKHDGYIVPFDLYGGRIKKGSIYIKEKDSSFYKPKGEDNIDFLLPIEIVETWEKHYPETEPEAKPDYSKVIDLIEVEIERVKIELEKCLERKEYLSVGEFSKQKDIFNYTLTKIKDL